LFLKTCCEYFKPICSTKGINLDTKIENSGIIFMMGQIDALEKIVFNYLSNAFKYSPPDDVIEVALKECGNDMIITIKNNGPGISKENQAKLFKIFSQADDQMVHSHEGTGLGLALVKELAGAMKGEVFVESSGEKGALFGVKFPKCSYDVSPGKEEICTELSINVKDFDDFQPKKWHTTGMDAEALNDESVIWSEGKIILIVDDLKDMRDLIVNLLKPKGYQIITAKDGFEGLQKASVYGPDLIIVDWMMPNLSGPAMIEKMIMDSKLKTIPTILLTARSDQESKAIGIGKGAHAYLSKPFNSMELMSTVENLICLKQSEKKIMELNRHLTENVLKRFLPHKLVKDICLGTKVLDDKPKFLDVTILFADLVNFTNKAENLGAHIISLLLNEYFDRMTEIVFEFGGTIDKFIGDGIMVIFGAPEEQTSEAQVQNAICCAKSMQTVLRQMNLDWSQKYNMEFSMRIGIHRGSCIVGSFGGKKRSEYTAIGPVVNMTSRIVKVAAPESIFFSSVVRDYIYQDEWTQAGTYDLKGIGQTVLYRINLSENEKAA
ncbi:MAG: response regulator, partial [Oligoflexales bacterium]|nr:response regulator [Oligoflexales bacterium]